MDVTIRATWKEYLTAIISGILTYEILNIILFGGTVGQLGNTVFLLFVALVFAYVAHKDKSDESTSPAS